MLIDKLLISFLSKNNISCVGFGNIFISDSFIFSNDMVATISLENINESDIKIFPNPTHDILFFERNEINNLSISIINTTGNIVYEKIFFDNIISVSLKDLEPGMYLIKLQDDTGISYKNVLKL